jgi:hypothetical protein
LREKGETDFYNMPMLAFCGAILLVSVWARDTKRDPNALEKGVKRLILPSPVGLDS